eukprot:6202390-Pleurochrysis_carterae.AAC.1
MSLENDQNAHTPPTSPSCEVSCCERRMISSAAHVQCKQQRGAHATDSKAPGACTDGSEELMPRFR